MVSIKLVLLILAFPICGTLIGELVRRRGKKFYLLILPIAVIWITIFVGGI